MLAHQVEWGLLSRRNGILDRSRNGQVRWSSREAGEQRGDGSGRGSHHHSHCNQRKGSGGQCTAPTRQQERQHTARTAASEQADVSGGARVRRWLRCRQRAACALPTQPRVCGNPRSVCLPWGQGTSVLRGGSSNPLHCALWVRLANQGPSSATSVRSSERTDRFPRAKARFRHRWWTLNCPEHTGGHLSFGPTALSVKMATAESENRLTRSVRCAVSQNPSALHPNHSPTPLYTSSTHGRVFSSEDRVAP